MTISLFVIIPQEDEEKDPDDLMEHERPAPKIDFSKMDAKNPESILQMSKKGKTLMMFVTVSGDPTQEEAETITQRWQDQLFNANFQLQRYMVDSNRAIFLLKDGALAWEMKNFLIDQDRCYEVTIDNKSYYGKGSGRMDENTPAGAKKDSKSKTKKGKGKKKEKIKVENNKTELMALSFSNYLTRKFSLHICSTLVFYYISV
ncbi:LRP chaperone MESD-like [Lytechinus pictus]|uniref:LRP chaperone MESD-like n=1 Tax=Lytechinus pictus TaxID=7653 RepID=UPI0030B9C972